MPRKRADAPPPWWLDPLAWRLAETMEIAQSDGRPKDADTLTLFSLLHHVEIGRLMRQQQRAPRSPHCRSPTMLRPPQVGLINGLPPFEAVAPLLDRPLGSPVSFLETLPGTDALTWSLTDAAAARQAAYREAPPDQRGCASDRDSAARRTLADADCGRRSARSQRPRRRGRRRACPSRRSLAQERGRLCATAPRQGRLRQADRSDQRAFQQAARDGRLHADQDGHRRAAQLHGSAQTSRAPLSATPLIVRCSDKSSFRYMPKYATLSVCFKRLTELQQWTFHKKPETQPEPQTCRKRS